MSTANRTWDTSTGRGSLGDWARQGAVVLATILVLVVNWLATSLPINGQDTGEISDQFDVLFVPAGYAFSIWGLIYLLLIGYTVYHSLPSQRANPLLRRTGYLYVITCLANSSWIFLWHYLQFGLSVLVMLLLLASLIFLYRTIGKHPRTRAEQWLVQLPFSIYLGWITVATGANITIFLEYLGWNGFGLSAAIWAVIVMLVAATLGILFGWRFNDWAYSSVLIWALIAIAVKHSAVPLVAYTAIAVSALLALVIVVGWLRRGFTLQPLATGE